MTNFNPHLLFERLARFILKNRVSVTVITILVILSLSFGATRVQPNFSLTAFYGGEDPARIYFNEYTEFWGNQEMALVVVVSSKTGDLLTENNLQTLDKIAQKLNDSDSVDKVTNLATISWMRGGAGNLRISKVIDTVPSSDWGASAEDLAKWRKQILSEEAFVPALISADGSLSAMQVELAGDIDEIDVMVDRVAEVREMLSEIGQNSDLVFNYAGVPAVRTDFFGVFYKDQMIFGPVMMLLMVITLVITLRKLHGVVIPIVAAMIPTAMVIGMMGYLGADLDLVTQTLITLLPAIAVADAIHLVSRFHEEARAIAPAGHRLSPDQRHTAIIESVKAIGGACFLTTTTTAIGFVSLMMAQMPILRDFGIYAATGVLMAYGSVLVVIPLMMSVTKGTVADVQKEDAPTLLERFLSRSAHISTRRPKIVVAISALVCLLFGAMSTQVTVDNNLTQMLYDEHPTTMTNLITDNKLGGIISTEIDLKGATEGAALDHDLLTALVQLEDEIKTWEGVRWVGSPATMLADAMQLLSGERTIPDSQAGVAQVLMLMEGHPQLKEVLSFDRSRSRVVIRMQDNGALAFQEFSSKLNQRIEESLSEHAIEATQSGTITIAYKGINNVAHDLKNSLSFAFVLITIAILIIFRSPKMALIALIPTAMPLVCGYGLLYILGWPLDPSTGMVFTVALGIAIDDSIHMLARYKEERLAKHSVSEAATRAVKFSGKAVAITSLMVGFGLGVNIFSSFPMLTVLGAIGAFMMFMALICDVYLLPSLLVLLERD